MELPPSDQAPGPFSPGDIQATKQSGLLWSCLLLKPQESQLMQTERREGRNLGPSLSADSSPSTACGERQGTVPVTLSLHPRSPDTSVHP